MHGFHYTLAMNITLVDKNEFSRIITKKAGDAIDFENDDKEYDSILRFIEMNTEFVEELITSMNRVTAEL